MYPRTFVEIEQLVRLTAAAQFGLVGYTQLIASGLSRPAISRRVTTGRLERILPRVYRIGGASSSWEQELMAATLWGGPGSAICAAPAAALWGIGGFQGDGIQAEVAVTANVYGDGLPFVVHRLDEHLLPEIDAIQGIPTTSVRKTILDLAGRKHRRSSRTLDNALFKGLTTLQQMWLFHDQEWLRGRRGIAILRLQLIDRTPGKAPTQTDLEDLFKDIVQRFDLPRPDHQYAISLSDRAIRVDFAYPWTRLVVECDSRTWHLYEDSFDSDRDRDNQLKLLGWTVLRFTWSMLRYEPEKVALMVQAHLARNAHLVPSAR